MYMEAKRRGNLRRDLSPPMIEGEMLKEGGVMQKKGYRSQLVALISDLPVIVAVSIIIS